jgi:peptidoglycan/LPS O-acetylase OafA/YrhL
VIPTPGSSSGRIHELDALRGIAAMGVVLWHYADHFGARPLELALHPFYNAGFLLVDFFFVLSGYVIARAYWKPSRQSQPLRNIWARVARLYPLHLLTLLLVVALLAAMPAGVSDPSFDPPSNDARHLVLNLLLLNQSGLQSGWSFNTPAWSISTEFIVNVAFLAAIALAPRTRWAVAVLLALAIAAYYALARPPLLDGDRLLGLLDVNLMRCALGFCAGVGIQLLLQGQQASRWLRSHPRCSELLGVCALVAMTALMLASQRHPPIWHYLLSIAIAVGCVLFIPFGVRSRQLLRARALVFLGDVSYSIYLVHFPLQLALHAAALRLHLEIPYDNPAVLLAFAAAVIGLAAVTHRFVELPGQARLLALAPRRSAQPA